MSSAYSPTDYNYMMAQSERQDAAFWDHDSLGDSDFSPPSHTDPLQRFLDCQTDQYPSGNMQGSFLDSRPADGNSLGIEMGPSFSLSPSFSSSSLPDTHIRISAPESGFDNAQIPIFDNNLAPFDNPFLGPVRNMSDHPNLVIDTSPRLPYSSPGMPSFKLSPSPHSAGVPLNSASATPPSERFLYTPLSYPLGSNTMVRSPDSAYSHPSDYLPGTPLEGYSPLQKPLEGVTDFGPHVQAQVETVAELAARWVIPGDGPLLPQRMYRPHTVSDRRRYVDEVQLESPIMFSTSEGYGISIPDAISSRFASLIGRDDSMFENRGPSVSIRLMWPGYTPWSRQIPTRDFRNPPQPITRAKLAKNVAKTIQRFIEDMKDKAMEDDASPQWRVGNGHIRAQDLVLVGLQHVSMGSWQAHVRVRHRR